MREPVGQDFYVTHWGDFSVVVDAKKMSFTLVDHKIAEPLSRFYQMLKREVTLGRVSNRIWKVWAAALTHDSRQVEKGFVTMLYSHEVLDSG